MGRAWAGYGQGVDWGSEGWAWAGHGQGMGRVWVAQERGVRYCALRPHVSLPLGLCQAAQANAFHAARADHACVRNGFTAGVQ